MIYEYRCGAGHVTEHDYPMGEAPEKVRCGHPVEVLYGEYGDCICSARRVYGLGGVEFKGKGWGKDAR